VRVVPAAAAGRFVAAPSFAVMTMRDSEVLAFSHGPDGRVDFVGGTDQVRRLQEVWQETLYLSLDTSDSRDLVARALTAAESAA
jgi:hypothetical protein